VPGYFSDALVMNSGRQVVFLVNSVSIKDTVAKPQGPEGARSGRQDRGLQHLMQLLDWARGKGAGAPGFASS
jgi:hypothetical protein